jgi:hypothetical protein
MICPSDGVWGRPIPKRQLSRANAGSDLVVRFVTSREVFIEFPQAFPLAQGQVLSRINSNWTKRASVQPENPS